MATEEKTINYKYNLTTYWNLLKPYKKWIIILLAALLIVQALQTLDQYLLKIIIDKGTEFSAHTIGKEEFITALILVIGIFIASSIFKIIIKWFTINYINRLETYSIRDLKQHYFNHILHLDHEFHTTHKTGSLISKITRGASAIERLSDTVVYNFLPIIFQVILSVGTLAYLDKASALTIVIVTLAFIGYSLWIQREQEPANIESNEAEDFEKANISDVFTNIDSIKYFGKEEGIKKRYASITETTKEKSLRLWDHYRKLDAGQQLILALGTLALIIFPVLKFINGETTLGTLAFIMSLYTGLIISELFDFVSGIRGFSRSMSDLQPLFEYGMIENAIKDKQGAKKLEITKGTIEFKNVNFSYKKRKIFENFNLAITKNEKVAIVGHSGSGKTTLIKLLYRLYDVDQGEILIDGKDIKEYQQESLRSELSIVPQECVLFDDTIYNNIAFSNPKATKEDIWNALKFAQLDKIIEEFPNKEETIVGERGVKLSGGEKQRVSIARAILADKKILVLDEATSSLDSETEHEIQKALEKLMKGRTTIIIAHRLSTIMNADRILVMEKGEIVQQGNHEELITQEGHYQKLWNLQKGGYIK